MNLEEYHLKRQREAEKQQLEFSKNRTKCLQCMRKVEACFCHELKPFDTKFAFCILMHPKEAKKERIATGRLCNIILDNSQIIIDEHFDQNKQVQTILRSPKYFPMLLYPGTKSINLSNTDLPIESLGNRTPIIFVIDATWSCAKSMMRESTCLHQLPRISFEIKTTSRFSVKQQPAKYCLSTIESVYEVLSLLELQKLEELGESKEMLLFALKKLVDYQIECANDPSKANYRRKTEPFHLNSERVPSKKWEKRNICYEGRPKCPT